MEKKEFNYEIAGCAFTLRQPLIGQTKQLLDLFRRAGEDGKQFSIEALGDLIEDNLAEFVAIVLVEDGTAAQEKDVAALVRWIEGNCPAETALEIVADFFVCNPPHRLAATITRVLRMVSGVIQSVTPKPPSTGRSSSLPGETSPGGTASFGASPSPNASPGCASEDAI